MDFSILNLKEKRVLECHMKVLIKNKLKKSNLRRDIKDSMILRKKLWTNMLTIMLTKLLESLDTEEQTGFH